ncbi:glutamate-cysteine ligase [Ectothiorhodosinus mongolicus]|uniref:Glutamate--cysteine ligase n=1 Tax=Ectothiorhodosinus mongolicus TaxID=233100 RepID=A0A1R3W026_9GAMM|nr:glutamate--cysteine ligase [Ectothiorhodosinus mongolicus]SIT70673.1 glutamate-cysteine ligase [Ectothiorhodosinus mongolicus]
MKYSCQSALKYSVKEPPLLYSLFQQRLQAIIDANRQHSLSDRRVGLEKEALRVNAEGMIAKTPHPAALGSALTHPNITTDYSEALLEFITPPCDGISEAMEFLEDLHSFTYQRLDEEILWAASMPCVLEGEQGIPIAHYGSSNLGRMKTVYRRGLGHRYGRIMQVISGCHFNFSMGESFWTSWQELFAPGQSLRQCRDEAYFGMIRNLQRLGWLVPYLFGASPAVCRTFLGGKPTTLAEFDEGTYYEPYATSLRMGDIGYQNRKEEETGIKANYDGLDSYVKSLEWAINTPSSQYEKIGVLVEGDYRQLNANVLQIENEYYSTVRPKPLTQGVEKPTLALKRGGVAYVELRSLDVNPFEPTGLDRSQLHFLELLMIFALLCDSPRIDELERLAIDHNQSATAHRGRDPKLALLRKGEQIGLREWAAELLQAMGPLAAALDVSLPTSTYSMALQAQQYKLADASLTPSARMLGEMADQEEGFHRFAKRISLEHADWFEQRHLSREREVELEALATDSLLKQAQIEASDKEDFAAFLRHYAEQR